MGSIMMVVSVSEARFKIVRGTCIRCKREGLVITFPGIPELGQVCPDCLKLMAEILKEAEEELTSETSYHVDPDVAEKQLNKAEWWEK